MIIPPSFCIHTADALGIEYEDILYRKALQKGFFYHLGALRAVAMRDGKRFCFYMLCVIYNGIDHFSSVLC